MIEYRPISALQRHTDSRLDRLSTIGIAEFAGLEFAELKNDGLENDGLESDRLESDRLENDGVEQEETYILHTIK